MILKTYCKKQIQCLMIFNYYIFIIFKLKNLKVKKIKITPHLTNQRKWLILFPSLSFMHMYRFMCIFAKLSDYYVFVVHPTFSPSCWSGHFSTLKILMYFTFKCWLDAPLLTIPLSLNTLFSVITQQQRTLSILACISLF